MSSKIHIILLGITLFSTAQGQTQRPDDGSQISIQRASRPNQRREGEISAVIPPPERSRSLGVSREALKERLDSIILVLTRLGDRMVSMETKQSEQSERIDHINYRLTKLDLQNEERKGKFSEIWTTIRHRLEASGREMENIGESVNEVKETLDQMKETSASLNDRVKALKEDELDTDRTRQGPKLQTVLAAVFGVKSIAQTLRNDLDQVTLNITTLMNETRDLRTLEDKVVTKQDFHLGLAGVLEKIESRPMVTMTTGKESKNRKGESTDCWELLHKRGKSKSGVYRIQPPLASRPFFVYCDMETDGGGWVVIQRREDGTQDFKRSWNDYKAGFGNLAGEFWLGNEKIFQITNDNVNELKIKLTDFSHTTVKADYKAFAIGPESEGFALRLLSTFQGDAGDSLSYHVGQKWSTYDFDNDGWPEKNCARDNTGAWWYKACSTSNLNGAYLQGAVPPGDEYKGVYWYDFHGPQYSLWSTTMMIRRGGSVRRHNKTVPSHIKHSPYIPHPLE